MVQSVSLAHWIRCSVSVVGLVATNCALSTRPRSEVVTAYIVGVPTGIKMPFNVCFITEAAILYSKKARVSV